jgi:hypothetical protein
MSQRKSLIDQLLEEAQKRGIYNPHNKAERHLDLGDDTNVPESDRLGYHVLKSNGFTPPFIMERQQLLHDRDVLTQRRDALRERWARLSRLQRRTEYAGLHAQYTELWRRTMDYNLMAPLALHIEGVRVTVELRDLDVDDDPPSCG